MKNYTTPKKSKAILLWRFCAGMGSALTIACLFFFSKSVTGQNGAQVRPENYSNYLTTDVTYDSSQILKMIDDGDKIADIHQDSAIVFFSKALEYSQRTDYAYGVTKAALKLTSLYANKGMYQQALQVLWLAIPYTTKSPEAFAILPRLYSCIAVIYHVQGNFKMAVQYYYHAIAISEKIPASTGTEYIYNNLAGIFNHMGEEQQALYYLGKAEKQALLKNDNSLLESIYLNRGIIYLSQKNWEKSKQHFLAALSMANKYHFSGQFRFTTLTNLASIALSQDDPKQALSYLLTAQKIDADISESYRTTELYYLGDTYYKLHDYVNAKKALLVAYDKSKRMELLNQSTQIELILSNVYAETGEYQKALQHHEKYVVLKDSIEGMQVTNNLNQYEIKSRVAEKDKDIAQKQLLITQQERRLERKNIWLISIMACVLIFATFIFGRYKNYQHKQEIGQLKAMIAGEEKERNRIGQELHDGIGGMLAAINMNLGTVQKKHQDISQMKDLDEISIMLQSTATEVRKTAHNLMPDILLRHGFTEAVRLYCEQVSSGDKLRVDSQFYGNLDLLEKPTAFSLYRIIQELIQNVIKHAQATHAVVQVRQYENQLAISVEDNGVGFDPTEMTAKGFGLMNLKSRTQALQGHISVESSKGQGTTAYIELDLQKLRSTTTV